MEWIFTLLYITGALVTHYIIYREGEENIDSASANIAGILWPVTLALCVVLMLERTYRKLRDWICVK